jgi:L-threonylcarbamoyladenylate synthase
MNRQQIQEALQMLRGSLPAGKAAAPESKMPALAVYSRGPRPAAQPGVLWRSMPADAAAAAHELFGALRELDDALVPLIWVEEPPSEPAWDGVRDRLQRAAAA